MLDHVHTLHAYTACELSTNTTDDTLQAALSQIEIALVPLNDVTTGFTAWIGTQDLNALANVSVQCSEHSFQLQRMSIEATHLMPEALEQLASKLTLSGAQAWSKLHSDVTSQIMVSVPGLDSPRPMTVVRNMAHDRRGSTRKDAYNAELSAWSEHSVPLAAALNGIKGEVLTLSKERNWTSPLHESLFGDNIDAEIIEAMMAAAEESFVDFRRYLNLKASHLGKTTLPWYDMFAPVGKDSIEWSWQTARDFLVQHFSGFSANLSSLAARAFDDRWIDAVPRPGKVGGAYCELIQGGESRILTNYEATFANVSTLAHELGHAYHNLCLAEKSALQKNTPMALAETASIFCETIIRHAALQEADEESRLAILEASLQGSCQIVVDIASRFKFESMVFQNRKSSQLSPDEFCTLMITAQLDTYGDGLDSSALHPYMWAVKGHYYSSQSYYNYPYMFGMLFGLGLYEQYRLDGTGFVQQYEELLASTGLADAKALTSRFGIDITKIEFWRQSLNVVRRDITEFEQLVKSAT